MISFKHYWIVLLVIIGLKGYSQKIYQQTGVLDAAMVSEKYFITAMGLDYSYDLSEDIFHMYIGDSLNLSDEQQKMINEHGFNYLKEHLPFCYLLHEDDFWSQRVYRIVNFTDSTNAHFTRGGFREHRVLNKDRTISRTPQYFHREAFFKWVRSDLEKGYLTPYADISYHYADSSFVDQVLDQFDQIDHLMIKEDWYYDKVAGEIKTAVIGVGFMLKGSTMDDQKPLFWAYYPELFYGASANTVMKAPYQYFRWSKIIEEHYYTTHEIKIDGIRDNTRSWDIDEYFAEDNTHRNDFEALIQIALVQEYIQRNRPKFNGEIKDTTAYGTIIKGELAYGIPIKTWHVDDPKNEVVIEMEFFNGVAHGSYTAKYYGNQVKEEGTLSMGKKAGTWTCYHPNGKKLSLKHYQNGWLEGDQEVYHEDGSIHLAYNYTDHMISGPFTWNNKQGVTILQGEFTDNYINGTWKINLPLSENHLSILKANPNVDWGFDLKLIKDGYLPYTVEVEQYTDLLYCSWRTCIRFLSFSFGH